MDVSPRLRAGLLAFGALTGAALLAYAANTALGLASGLDGFFDHYVYTGLIVAAGSFCLARGFAVPDERTAWLTMGAGLMAWAAGEITWSVMLAANPNAPFKDFGQLLEALKKDGAKVTIATAGLSSAGHNFMESVKAASKIDYKHVTYDGGNPAVLAAVSGETQAVSQLLVEMTEMIKAKRLVPLAVLSDKPITLEGYGEIAPTTKWLPSMPAPMNYFGIWVPRGAPDNVVKTMSEVWEKKIKTSEALKKYSAARSALFAPLHGDEAERESFKMVRYSAWLYFDAGKAKVSPDTLGIPRL